MTIGPLYDAGFAAGVAAERERCASIIEAECARVLALQKAGVNALSIDESINLNLRMTTVLLPGLAASIRNDQQKVSEGK